MAIQRDIEVTEIAMPVDEVAKSLRALQKAPAENPDGTIFITDQEETTMVLLSWEAWQEMAGLMETLEVLADPEAMAAIKRAKANAVASNAIPWESVKEQLVAERGIEPDQV